MTRSMPVRFLALFCLILMAVACGKPARTGSEKLLDFEDAKNQKRLGDPVVAPTAAAPSIGALGARPSPPPPPPPPPKPEEKFFDVVLVADSPYYEPGNELVMSKDVTLRVTNKDTTAERPRRSFTAEDGSFDSGPMGPGAVWTVRLGVGTWRIKDMSAPFIFATLDVR